MQHHIPNVCVTGACHFRALRNNKLTPKAAGEHKPLSTGGQKKQEVGNFHKGDFIPAKEGGRWRSDDPVSSLLAGTLRVAGRWGGHQKSDSTCDSWRGTQATVGDGFDFAAAACPRANVSGNHPSAEELWCFKGTMGTLLFNLQVPGATVDMALLCACATQAAGISWPGLTLRVWEYVRE